MAVMYFADIKPLGFLPSIQDTLKMQIQMKITIRLH